MWRNATKRVIEVHCAEVANCWNERSRGYIGIRRMEAAARKTKDLSGGGDRMAKQMSGADE